jgi:hypothetical protein
VQGAAIDKIVPIDDSLFTPAAKTIFHGHAADHRRCTAVPASVDYAPASRLTEPDRLNPERQELGRRAGDEKGDMKAYALTFREFSGVGSALCARIQGTINERESDISLQRRNNGLADDKRQTSRLPRTCVMTLLSLFGYFTVCVARGGGPIILLCVLKLGELTFSFSQRNESFYKIICGVS